MGDISKAENERYLKLAEESGETVQSTCKLLNHGRVAEFEGTAYDNVGDVEREIGNVFAAVDLLIVAGDLSAANIQRHRVNKLREITRFLTHQPPNVKAAVQDLAEQLGALNENS